MISQITNPKYFFLQKGYCYITGLRNKARTDGGALSEEKKKKKINYYQETKVRKRKNSV